jgi:ribonuclease P protein component
VLAYANRITKADDYRGVVRRGSRFVAPNTVSYVRSSSTHGAKSAPVETPASGERSTPLERRARFGFIVAKSVGVAVVRNRVRRRLKAASYSLLPLVEPGTDVVIRALPQAASQPYSVLCDELMESLRKGRVLA